MTAQNDSTKATRKASIRDLLQARTHIAEKLAGALDDYATATAAVMTAQRAAAEKASKVRDVYQQAIDTGWTATELISAGLKPPAPPRKRAISTEDFRSATSG